MGHIHSIRVQDNTYLIEPLLFSATSGTASALTANIDSNFELIEGIVISIEANQNVNAGATLNVNGTGAKWIFYEGASIGSGILQSGQVYMLLYANNVWNVLNFIPLASSQARGGVKIGYTTDDTNRCYAVQLDSNEQMYVNVPWVGATTIDWSNVLQTPTTVAGYGITDAITSVNGKSGSSITLTPTDIGLDTALRFIGVVATNSSYQPSDGQSGVPTIIGKSSYTPATGDVIFDKDSLREYVYANGAWYLLGYTASNIYDSNSVTATSANIPTWISRIQQNTDGTISVEKETMGILPLSNGGTGTNTFTADQVVLTPTSNGTSLTSRAYSDYNQATVLSDQSTNFITERSVYFGMPTINNTHNYDSSTSIFASTTSGASGQILISAGANNAPVWAQEAYISSTVSNTADEDAFTSLTLGNNVGKTSAINHSEGILYIYSSATGKHILSGAATNTDYTHTLPNNNGYLVQKPDTSAVGSATNPVYIAADGTATALSYTVNCLYYSASTTSFTATNHYADSSHIGINYTGENTPSVNLYVNGTTYFNGNTTHNGIAYFANGTTYYINNSAVAYLPDLRADKVRLTENWIGFYSAANAGTSLLGKIQGTLDHMHFTVENGTANVIPDFDFNGHILPSTNQVGNLGSNTKRWNKLYVGTADSYGDAYTPVYWNDGVPADVTPVQYCAFTIHQNQIGVELAHDAFTADSYVIQIVVTSGESNLNSPISWESDTGIINLTTTSAPSNDVSGYILVSRGGAITPTATDITNE